MFVRSRNDNTRVGSYHTYVDYRALLWCLILVQNITGCAFTVLTFPYITVVANPSIYSTRLATYYSNFAVHFCGGWFPYRKTRLCGHNQNPPRINMAAASRMERWDCGVTIKSLPYKTVVVGSRTDNTSLFIYPVAVSRTIIIRVASYHPKTVVHYGCGGCCAVTILKLPHFTVTINVASYNLEIAVHYHGGWFPYIIITVVAYSRLENTMVTSYHSKITVQCSGGQFPYTMINQVV